MHATVDNRSSALDMSAFSPVSLTARDRCDRCGAAAFVAAHHQDHASLLFCGHHYAKHESALLGSGWVPQDERDRINVKPSVSANSD